MVSTSAFNSTRVDLIAWYCSFQCSGAGCGLSRDCCTGFCLFRAPEREDLVGSVASSTLALILSENPDRLDGRFEWGAIIDNCWTLDVGPTCVRKIHHRLTMLPNLPLNKAYLPVLLPLPLLLPLLRRSSTVIAPNTDSSGCPRRNLHHQTLRAISRRFEAGFNTRGFGTS